LLIFGGGGDDDDDDDEENDSIGGGANITTRWLCSLCVCCGLAWPAGKPGLLGSDVGDHVVYAVTPPEVVRHVRSGVLHVASLKSYVGMGLMKVVWSINCLSFFESMSISCLRWSVCDCLIHP